MPEPTEEQVQEEIKKLKELKPKVPQMTGFEDDNHKAIDAQVEVLEQMMDEGEIDDKEDLGEWDNHTADSARDAANWLVGDEEEPPSAGWEALVK